MVLKCISQETLYTRIMLDLLNGEVMECEAIVDTGSVLSIVSVEALKRNAAHLLAKLSRCTIEIHGVTGEEVRVAGLLEVPCKVAGKAILQFVVAGIVEPVLLGIDFMRKHKATWDWLIGDLVYQEGPLLPLDNACRLAEGQEIPPESYSCLRVAVDPCLPAGQIVHVEGSALTQHGLVVTDVISKVTDGSVDVLVENRADHPQWLPAGTAVGSWSALKSSDQLIPVEDEVVNEEDSSPCRRAGKGEVACPPELLAELEASLPHLSREDITGGERVAMMNVFQNYQDVFALKSTELG